MQGLGGVAEGMQPSPLPKEAAVGVLQSFAPAVICNLRFAALTKYSHLRAGKPVSKSADCSLLISLPWG